MEPREALLPPTLLPCPAGRFTTVRGVAVESLGGLEVAGRCLQVLRLGNVDVLCSARPRRAEGPPAFVATDTIDVVYETWPPTATPSRRELDALRVVCRALGARAAAVGLTDPWRGRAPSIPEILALLGTSPGVTVVQGPRTARGMTLSAETADGRVTWRVRERREGQPGLLGWSLAADQWGAPGPAAHDALRAAAFAQIAAFGSLLGLTVPWGAPVERVTRLGVDLGAPIAPALAALAAGLAEPAALDVRVTVPSRCECRCAFCVKREGAETPPVDDVLDGASALARALRPAATRGAPVTMVLIGDDALRFPALAQLMALVASCDPEGVTLVTPGTALSAPGVVEALVGARVPLTLSVTLHGPDEATHDRVAGLPGAFARLLDGLERCRQAGLTVQVGHVLTAPSLPALPQTLARAAALAPSVHLLFFASEPAHRDADAIDRGVLAAMAPPLRAVRRALEEHRALVEATVEALEGFPLCLVPPSLRERVRNDPHSRPDPPPHPPDACSRCGQYGSRCAGPEHGLLLARGDDGLSPLDYSIDGPVDGR